MDNPKHGCTRYGRIPVFCILLACVVLASSACAPPHPDLASYNIHTVAFVTLGAEKEVLLKGVPQGKGDAAARSARSAMGSLWHGCGQIMTGAGYAGPLIGMAAFAGTTIVCLGLTPLVGTSAALIGAAEGDRASDVQQVKLAMQENMPDVDRSVTIFEQALLHPGEKPGDGAFCRGSEFGLNDARKDADYTPLGAKGIDAVLEIDTLIVALNGKDLHSPLFLEVCAPVRLIATKDNQVLFADIHCRTSDSRSLDAWSADNWSAVKAETMSGLKELGGDYLYRLVFRK